VPSARFVRAAILANDSAHDQALAEIAELCRHAHQWEELTDALLARAKGAVAPAMSRDLQAEAAGLLLEHFDASDRAASIYEAIL
jgi:hypothetical protein